MRNMKDVLISKLGKSVSKNLGKFSIKLSEQAMGKCVLSACYEPKVPINLLKENMNK